VHVSLDRVSLWSARRLPYHVTDFTNVTLPATTTTTTNGPPAEAVINAMKTALDNYTSDNLPNRDLTDAINANFDFYLVGINGLDEVSS